jgi:hypothetical protein
MVSSLSSKPPIKLSQWESPPASPLAEEDIPPDVPVAFAAGIGAKDIQACIRLLNKCPDALTQSGSAFEWLRDLLAVGLNSTEIVDLLFEESEQSPWICYELVLPATHHASAIDCRPDYIQPALPRRYRDSIVRISEVEVKRTISELCGLGGIIPTPDDRTLWTENAIIRSSARSATIAYGYDAEWVRSESLDNAKIGWICKVLDSCSGALDRFVKLFRWL